MQKDDKCYAFLLSHKYSSKRIYIKRVEVSKSLVHFGSLGIFLALGLTVLGLGISTITSRTVLAKNLTVLDQLSTQAKPEIAAPADAVAFNSGGPEESLDQVEGENGENSQVDAEIAAVRGQLDAEHIPMIWPHSGKINNEFGFRRNPFGGRAYEFHPGMDIDGERGESVLAPASGTVIKAGYNGGYGNMIEIDHGNGLTTRYGHLSKIDVAIGDTVTRGETIGQIGSTGRSTGPHLHYELRLNDKSVNPRHVLPPESPVLETK